MSFDFQKYIENLEAEAQKNDIGKMLASGIGVGLDKNSYLAITAMENVYVELETLTKNAAKNAEKLAKKRQERELANLKNSLELELINEQEYFEKLKKYRDENLREGSDSWYKYTEEIISYNKKLMEESEKEQLEMLKTIQSLQKDLRENLESEDGPWYSSLKLIFRGLGENGRDLVVQKNSLSDFDEEIKRLELYRDLILQLKSLGNIPDGVFSDIAKMDVSEGIKAAKIILSADDAERQKFISGYNTKNSLLDSVSGELNGILNKEALEDAGIYSAESFNKGYFRADSEEKTLFIKTLEDSFSTIPESYYQLGIDSGNEFGRGFESRISEVMENARTYMISVMNDIVTEIKAAAAEFEAKSGKEGSKVYNTSYNFNSSRDTTTRQLATAKAAATLEKLRGGYQNGTFS